MALLTRLILKTMQKKCLIWFRKRVLHQPNIAVSLLPWSAAGDFELTVAADESTISRWRDWFI